MRRSSQLAQKFREAFSFPAEETAHFFPGHMAKGLSQMQRKLKDVDCIVEVHDARIPLSGRNPVFENSITLRPHLMVLNKMDLADHRYFQRAEAVLREEQGVNHFLYTNCKENHHVTIKKKLMPAILNLLTGKPRYHREGLDDFKILVIGIPNVGKSSLINALRRVHIKKGKATQVGPHAGVTKSVMEKIRVCDHPKIYVYDSPGIMMPKIDNMKVGMKLALCATLKDHIVGEDVMADYLLFWLNRHEYFKYVEIFSLPGPTDDIWELLTHISEQNKSVLKLRSTTGGYTYRPNFDMAAKLFIRSFRDGNLGRYTLDQDRFEKSTSDVT